MMSDIFGKLVAIAEPLKGATSILTEDGFRHFFFMEGAGIN